jgi:excinuclease UvrABC nuclease subunit
MPASPTFAAEALLGVQDFTVFPHLPAYQHRQFPDIAAIYIAFDPPNEVIYIGRTQSLKKRWRGCRTHPWLKAVCKIQVAWFLVEVAQQPALEKLLIEHYRPLGNICHNGKRKGR